MTSQSLNDQPARHPQTMWKLVDARCAQLADAVSSTRFAFLVALTWAFIWAWGLYSVEWGYLETHYRGSYETLYTLVRAEKEGEPLKSKVLQDSCKRILKVAPAPEISDIDRGTVCKEIIKTRFDWVEKQYLESAMITFPGGFGRLTVSDLSIVGQVGLFLVLSWSFFAVRRENHAVRAIVDMDEHTRSLNLRFPRSFVLIPKGPAFSAEHVVYAYHSVAQRFVFIFSQHSRPLFAFSMCLTALPAAVAFWNLATDVRDCFSLVPMVPSVVARTIIEFVIFIGVAGLTYGSSKIETDTSVLLNGWYLAARYVWMDEWDERTNEPASPASIDIAAQKAAPLGKSSDVMEAAPRHTSDRALPPARAVW